MIHVLTYAEIEQWVRDGKARAILSRKVDDMMVAVEDDELLGFVLVETDTIREIFVRLENHRQGVGRRLVQAAIDKVRVAGCPVIKVLVKAFNIPSNRLFQSQGFRLASITETAFFSHTLIANCYEKTLA
ncbi:GNAT family N-acetyltransferase [Dyella sp. A6]|uniref:GNAT family N-acetyltransferase n=1 Tax=Dyella aluminiiresistens TaxID=3069105 RepID=UPI002E78FF8C|nr:GNAT family N-acetyltransferase [Dyella sp. A6]